MKGYLAAGALVIFTALVDLCVDLDYRFWANVSLAIAALFTAVFAGLYLCRSRWWSNRIGRIYLAKSLVLPLVLGQGVVASWWDADYPHRQHIRWLIYTAGAFAYIPMIWSLWREQQRDRSDRE